MITGTVVSGGNAIDTTGAQHTGGLPWHDDWVVAGPPRAGVVVPATVEALAAGQPLRAVWVNELGGTTFEVGLGATRCFIKWAPAASGLDFAAEAARLNWAAPFTAVPRVLDQGSCDGGSWLVTAALRGESAVSRRWMGDPATAVAAIGRGLRALHEALRADACPFSWSVEDRLAARGPAAATDRLPAQPPIDRLVVCHGDACAPNTLIGPEGRWTGHVDLGSMGVADRWADLAVATWSTTWNYGPGWEERLLDAYGVAPDPERTRYYRLLWEL